MRRIFALVMLWTLCCGAALADEELLQNGGFEETQDGWPVGWYQEMWLMEPGASYLELREGGRNGGLCMMVENVAKNDARVVQDVAVEPEAVYRMSGWIRAEGIPEGNAGASLSLIGSYATFPEVHDTDGEWMYFESHIRTAEGQTTLHVGARLGDYSADNTGKAYFDDLSFVRVDDENVPGIIQMYVFPSGEESNTQAEAESKAPSLMPLLALFVVLVLAAWALRMRGVPAPKSALALVLFAALLVRLYLVLTQPGYPNDMSAFFAWSVRMANVGPNNFYSPDYFCDYPPGYMYLLWITGGLLKLFGITELNVAARVIVRSIPVLVDLGAVWLVWRLGRRRLGETSALLLAGLYAFSPAVLINAAAWGQVDSVLALGLLATVVLAVEGNWRAALPVFTVSVLMKPQALMAGPVGLVALLAAILPWRKESKRVLEDAGIGLAISLGVAVVMLLPFLWGKEAPLSWLIGQYTGTLSSYPYATLSAANLYYLLGANWTLLTEMLGPLSYGTWGTLLMVAVVLGTMALYLKRREPDRLPLVVALVFIGLYLLGVKMHERYLFPALLLLVYAYIRRPDWRVLAVFGGLSVTLFINCAVVLRDRYLPSGFGALGMTLAVIGFALYALGIWAALDDRARPLPVMRPTLPPRDRLAGLRAPTKRFARMYRRDWLAMLGLTLVYALVAFIGLGATQAPQTVWQSTGAEESVTFDLGEIQPFEIMYYAGINSREQQFTLSFSDDGEAWYGQARQKIAPGDCFRWQYATVPQLDAEGNTASWSDMPLGCAGRYVRLTFESPSVSLLEVAFRDPQGNVLPVASAIGEGARPENASDPMLLVDEGATMPDRPSYYNGTYFDEIYHARTGYEHANALSTYETTHPPLGKVFIMLGIQLFGMTPFGWRFMGALAGVLMVPAMYLLGKLLFGRGRYAFLAAFLMAFDMMHLTQTRIATIDSFAVLFIILMYLCMLRYLQMNMLRDGWKTLIPLGLAGLFMGLGCASKWICIYAGAGLAVLFFCAMGQRFLEWQAGLRAGGADAERVAEYPKYLLGTLGACLVFFIVVPCVIYYVSYIPWFAYEGGLTWDRFWNAQTSMFGYHAGLVDDHAFQSPWYEWPLMLKPMYYYDGKPFVRDGMVSTIMAMGNPAVWWVGFAAFVYLLWRWLRPYLRGERQQDARLSMILLSLAAQFLPWVLVPRSTFIYHYFGSLPFVMLCTVYAFEQYGLRRPERAERLQGIYMAAVLLLFVAFYPMGTGVQVPVLWADAVNWLRFLKLPGWKYRGWLYY